MYKAVSKRSRDLAEQGQQIIRVTFRKLKIKWRTITPTTGSQKKYLGEAVEVTPFVLLSQGKSQLHQKYYCDFHGHFPPSISLFWRQEHFSLCSTCCTELHQFFCCPPATSAKKWFLFFPQKQSNINKTKSLYSFESLHHSINLLKPFLSQSIKFHLVITALSKIGMYLFIRALPLEKSIQPLLKNIKERWRNHHLAPHPSNTNIVFVVRQACLRCCASSL